MKDGLISNNIESLFQDSKGFLWIGTSVGISVYDGYSFRNYSATDDLTGGPIRCFYESRRNSGMLWIGTSGDGVYQYDGRKFSKRVTDRTNSGVVCGMDEDNEGSLWCATWSGLFIIENTSLRELKLLEGSGAPTSVIVLNDSIVIIGTEYKLLKYSKKSERLTELNIGYKADPKLDRAILLAKENDSTFWVTANSGILIRYSCENQELVYSFPWDYALFIQKDLDDNIWLGRDQAGLYRISPKSPSRNPVNTGVKNGMPENSVWAMIQDKERNYWFGTHANGIVKLSEPHIVRFPFDEWGLKVNDRCVALDSSNHFWTATSFGMREVWRDSGGNWKSHLHKVSHVPKLRDVMVVQYDSSKILWLVYRKNLIEGYRILSNPNNASRLSLIRRVDLHKVCREGPPVDLFVDRHNRLWYSANGEGVAVLDMHRENPVLRFFSKSEGEQYYSVGSICEDESGNILLGTTFYGIVKLIGDIQTGFKFQSITAVDGLASNDIVCIFRDSKGRIWTGSSGSGISVVENNTIKTFSRKEGLPSNTVYTIREDNFGNIWFGTRNGPVFISPHEGWKVNVLHEMLGEYIPSMAKGPDDLMGIQTDLSFCIIDMSIPRHPSLPPPIYINDFEVDGEHFEIGGFHDFAHTQKYFKIGFLGISLKHEKELFYQYKLENIDSDWRAPLKDRNIILAAPKAGSYKFMVRAITPDGMASTVPAVLKFTINPPFYQRLWFVGSILIILLASTYAVVTNRVRKVRRERKAQREFSRRLIDSQEQERKRISSELHDSIGQELLIIKNRAMLGIEACPKEHPAKKELETISDISSQTIGEIREISYNLRPYQLDRLGLTKAITSLVTKTERSFEIRMSADVENIDNLLPRDREINIYRIVQEGLSNVVKHAGASNVWLEIRMDGNSIFIQIKDDGKGFDASRVESPSADQEGFGLRNIGERVRILEGSLTIQSNPERGTLISISIPFQRKKHEQRDDHNHSG